MGAAVSECLQSMVGVRSVLGSVVDLLGASAALGDGRFDALAAVVVPE
jgi:hypothetical protein